MRTIRFLLAFLLLAIPAASFGQIGMRIAIGPPALPFYDQPVCPGDGYLWTPGYWAYDDSVSDYYWVPGTWVLAPEEGYLWTPGYWGWGDGGYLFYDGYWGPTVGFYGGINYGFGYWAGGTEEAVGTTDTSSITAPSTTWVAAIFTMYTTKGSTKTTRAASASTAEEVEPSRVQPLSKRPR